MEKNLINAINPEKKGRGPGKEKYKAKHTLIDKYIPKEFQDLADSAYDHIGDLIKTTPLSEIIGLLLGVRFAMQLHFDFEKILLSGAAGVIAARGINSGSEVIGASSIGVLSVMGLSILLNPKLEETKGQVKILIDEYNNPDTSEERKKQLLVETHKLLWP